MKGDPIDDERLVALLDRQEQAAVGFFDGALAEQQEVALNAYYGRPYGDEEDGRSQFVTRDVAESIDYMTVSVLRAFVSGDHVVEFEGHDKASEVTAAMHYLFLRKQAGYRIIHDWLKGGLLEKIGVIKVGVETERRVEKLKGQVSALAIAQMQAEGVEIVAAEEVGEDESGPVYQIEARTERERRCFRDYNVPVDEFRFARRTVSEDSSDYLAHSSRKTRSALVEMGFDPDEVYALPVDKDSVNSTDGRAFSRFHDEDDGFGARAADDEPATQEVLLLEEYTFADRDGDGIAERVKAHRVGKTLLEASEVDDQPFVVFCPFPMPGVMVGQSLADKVLDIQRLSTVLTRQTLDNLYLTNAPGTWLHEDSIGESTIDDLLTVRPNGVKRWKGSIKPEPQVTPFVAQHSLQMLEWVRGERESRTGITRLNQGLDADALNKTATGTALMQQQGAQIEEYIARNFGECLARLFSKKLKLLTEFGEPFDINIDGEMVRVDPRTWPSEMDMNVQVGLGTGKKDQRIAMRQLVISLQAQAKEAGLPIVTPKQLYNSAAGVVADANLGAVNQYFTDPESEEGQALAQQPQAPDPEMLKLQGEQQKAAAQLQLDQQRAQADIEARRAESALKLQLQREEASAKLELDRAKAEQEATLAVEKMNREFALAERKMELEAELARENAARNHEAKLEAAKISSNRPGGDLSE